MTKKNDSLTINSVAINTYLHFIDVLARKGAVIPCQDLPAIRKSITELFTIIGGHYGVKD